MKMLTWRWLLACSFIVVVSLPAQAGIIFQDAANNAVSTRSSGESPLSRITVGANTNVAQIGVLTDLDSAGNLKFLIYDSLAANFVLITSPKAFADDGLVFKVSDGFTPVTLVPGRDYLIGAIADVGGQWPYLSPPGSFTQNGITNQGPNGEVTNYAMPSIGEDAASRIPLQLYYPAENGGGGGGGESVPEPTSLALLGLAAAAGAVARARRHGRAGGA